MRVQTRRFKFGDRVTPARTAGVVDALELTDGVTLLSLRGPDCVTTWRVDSRPDPAGARICVGGMRRVLAVTVTRGAGAPTCVALGTARRGPVRRSISLATALALAQSGVHTVVWPAPLFQASDSPSRTRPVVINRGAYAAVFHQ